jgi:hypothetical protein
MESDGDHFLAYYLMEKDDDAEAFKIRRKDPLADIDENSVRFSSL